MLRWAPLVMCCVPLLTGCSTAPSADASDQRQVAALVANRREDAPPPRTKTPASTVRAQRPDGPNRLARVGQPAPTPAVAKASADMADPFHLPGDAAGKLLGQVLPPRPYRGPLNDPRPRAIAPGPRLRLGEPTLPLGEVPRLPSRLADVAPRTTPRPEFALDETLGGRLASPEAPARPSFVAERPERIDREDVSIPVALPILGQPVVDRVSLEDATVGASLKASLNATLPRRETPAAYSRMSVPEPYENRQPLTVSLPEEDSTPQAVGIPRP